MLNSVHGSQVRIIPKMLSGQGMGRDGLDSDNMMVLTDIFTCGNFVSKLDGHEFSTTAQKHVNLVFVSHKYISDVQ